MLLASLSSCTDKHEGYTVCVYFVQERVSFLCSFQPNRKEITTVLIFLFSSYAASGDGFVQGKSDTRKSNGCNVLTLKDH